MSDVHVIEHNSVVVGCRVPAFVSDFVDVVSWLVEDSDVAPLYLREKGNYGTRRNGWFWRIFMP